MKKVLLFILVILVSGCVSQQPIVQDITKADVDFVEDVPVIPNLTEADIDEALKHVPEEAVINLCKQLCFIEREDLSDGPCISDDNAGWIFSDWVCDVAHSPREDIDDLPENQCQAFRSGEATRFVEVDTDCNYIGSN